MSLIRPSHLTYEQHFERECEFFQAALTREARSLHLLEDRRADTIQVICDLIVQLEIIGQLAKTMARKAPMCPTILISPPGYFLGEFQEFCRAKILPSLIRSLRYLIAGELEAAHEQLAFVLDSRE
ncbi:unnamed protein product [Penicillium glandicola]